MASDTRRSSVETVRVTGLSRAPAPGVLVAALFERYGLPYEAVGTLNEDAGDVVLQLDARQARRLRTPCPLRLDTERAVLRRRSDLPAPASHLELHIERHVDSAGSLAALLAPLGVASDDLGLIHQTPTGVTVELPRWRYRSTDFPSAVDGAALTVEKKNFADDDGLNLTAEDAASALASATDAFATPSDLARATRRALTLGRHDEDLLRAARRLAASGYTPRTDHVRFDPGLLVLTTALEPPATWEKALRRLESIPFPTETDQRAIEWLGRLQAEQQGELEPTEPLAAALVALADTIGYETRVLGTLCPGLRHDGRHLPEETPVSETADGLWGAWLEVCSELAAGRPVDPAVIAMVDELVRAAAADAGQALGSWPQLRALVEAEARGEAAPVHTPLTELTPGTERWEATVLANIDRLALAGHWDRAAAAATDALRSPRHTPAILLRYLRLAGVAGKDAALGSSSAWEQAATSDGVPRLFAAERAWRAGDLRAATAHLLDANLPADSWAADHAATRLLDLRRWADGARLVGPGAPAPLRTRAHAATEDWEAAAASWAQSVHGRAGLVAPPSWADASVLALLSEGGQALLAGLASPPAPSLRAATLPEVLWQTPDPRPALLALATAADAVRSGGSKLAERLVGELEDAQWTPHTAAHVLRIAHAVADPTALLQAIGTARLVSWLDTDLAPQVAPLLEPIAASEPQVKRALEHSGPQRLEAARTLARANPDEAANAALSVLRRAASPLVRQQCAQLIHACGHTQDLAALITPDRDAGVLVDTLTAITPLPEALVATLDALESHPSARVRSLAKTLR